MPLSASQVSIVGEPLAALAVHSNGLTVQCGTPIRASVCERQAFAYGYRAPRIYEMGSKFYGLGLSKSCKKDDIAVCFPITKWTLAKTFHYFDIREDQHHSLPRSMVDELHLIRSSLAP